MGARRSWWEAPKDQARHVESVGAGECPRSGKVGYLSRADAKRVAKRQKHRTGRMRAYSCESCGWWHVGHLPSVVVRGKV